MNRREFVALTPAFPAAAVSASLTVRETGKDPIDLDVSVLKLQPGDVLVLRSAQSLSQNQVARISALIQDRFGVKALVLDADLSLDGVIRGLA